MDKKPLIVNLSEEQEEKLKDFAKRANMNKTNVVRLLIDMISDLNPEETMIVAADLETLKMANSGAKFEIINCNKDSNISEASLEFEFSRYETPACTGTITLQSLKSFGGGNGYAKIME